MKTSNKPSTLTLDEFRAEEGGRSGNGCTLAHFLETQSPTDRATIDAAIKDPSIQATAIIRVLKRRGYAKNYQVITRHRRQECAWCAALPKA